MPKDLVLNLPQFPSSIYRIVSGTNMMRVGIGLSVLFAACLSASSDAVACSCSYVDPKRVFEYGDLIAEGTVQSVDIPASSACSAKLFEWQTACPKGADAACDAPYRERLKGCPDVLPGSFSAVAKVSLTEIWKGPQTHTIALNHPAGDSSSCAINLTPGQRIALIAHRTDSGEWSTNMCDVGPAGSFGRTDNEFGAVAHPLLEAYRAEGWEIGKKVAAEPTSIDAGLALAAYQAKGHDFEAALATYRNIVTRAPRTTVAYLAMARILKEQGKLFPALHVAREGLAQVPDDPDLLKFQSDLGFESPQSD
ncbi:MAG: hypothetical protein JNL25_06620 [Rhodospirillaceae bacterium]|nr:hypothetical protein [Rhodospirillaceae bacterium]